MEWNGVYVYKTRTRICWDFTLRWFHKSDFVPTIIFRVSFDRLRKANWCQPWSDRKLAVSVISKQKMIPSALLRYISTTARWRSCPAVSHCKIIKNTKRKLRYSKYPTENQSAFQYSNFNFSLRDSSELLFQQSAKLLLSDKWKLRNH